ncbi:conserved hypothetical protein, partial [Ricinus communis]
DKLPHGDIWSTKQGYRPSWACPSLLEGMSVLNLGTHWNIGSSEQYHSVSVRVQEALSIHAPGREPPPCVVWRMLRKGELKVNTNVSFIKGRSEAHVAFVCRDFKGDVVHVAIKKIKGGSNMAAEVITLTEANKFVRSQGFSNVKFKTNSSMVAKCLQNHN